MSGAFPRGWHGLVPLLVIGLAACDRSVPPDEVFASGGVAGAMATIRPEAIETHMRVLSHDSLAGRAPGTRGYEGASRYVESVFNALALQPAGADGTYRQPVPLHHSVVNELASAFSLERDGRTTDMAYGRDFYLTPSPGSTRESVTAPVAFVGYGVSAPDFDYDDYADIDVRGKIVAHLSGAPSTLPSSQRAYFSSGATKNDEASRRGAVGVITFSSPDDARFQWDASLARSRRGSFAWLGDAAARVRRGELGLRGSATLNQGGVRALFARSPTPLADVFAAAAANTPQAFDLPVEATIQTVSIRRPVASHNLVARLQGSDPELRDEHVVYVAHLDHLGIGEAVRGDSIYNGAHDNASGTAIVLEIARAFATLPQPPRRSVLFLVVTAEEWGLLGSDYFVHYPTVPRSGLVAAMSLDMPFLYHPLLDIVPYGAEHSSLSEAVGAAASHLGLGVGSDPIPEQVLFIRSDHFSFVRQGIPALFIKSGFETGDDRDGGAINAAFRRDRYHTPDDEINQGFDFEAGVGHAQVNFLTGYYVTMQTARPEWNRRDFFGTRFGQNR